MVQASLVLWELIGISEPFFFFFEVCDRKLSLCKNSHILICTNYFKDNMKSKYGLQRVLLHERCLSKIMGREALSFTRLEE